MNDLPEEVRDIIHKQHSGFIKRAYRVDNNGIVTFRIILSHWFKEKEVKYDLRGTFLG